MIMHCTSCDHVWDDCQLHHLYVQCPACNQYDCHDDDCCVPAISAVVEAEAMAAGVIAQWLALVAGGKETVRWTT